ncbi:MAG: hypothetical protein JNL71_06240 [Rhodospirillales bacterium]|nr:hypothetical protein [Rhodospirillales bacterium]
MSGDANDPVEALILDFIEWLAATPRGYAEAMGAWRTSCPRLPVWEESADRGYVARRVGPDGEIRILPTEAGLRHLADARPQPSFARTSADRSHRLGMVGEA